MIHLIGGGVKDVNLCRFTASVTGRKVTAGPVEATAMGNIAVQLIALGVVRDVSEARGLSDDLKVYTPENPELWEEKYRKYLAIKGRM